jgi:CheY-like chemotaxis protein/HPt (histidine-containing phosphotransfer) domain-containing protein/anti-sigma regulatory factor (Ser/Thr protein kinase)
MNTSAGLLLHHVNGVLSMSRAEAGQLDLRVAEIDPSTLLQELVESQRPVIEAHGNQILCDTSAAPDLIWVDALRLRQVILNLVGNANKFTRRGEIRLECDVIPDSHQVEFRVTDTGIGIPEAELDSIFEEFRTLDSSYGRQAEGTGLGLAISRRLVRAMGGEIGVDSEPGEGSLFWVRLPIGQPQKLERKTKTGAAKRKLVSETDNAPDVQLHVLLVEDNQINRLVARDMLQKCGHTVLEAHDGREGVRFASSQAFDLILMDISMPDLDGIAATSIIRDTDGPNRTTPIIALTAHALPEDAARFHAAGITSTLLKPLSFATLKNALAVAARPSEPVMHDAEPQMAAVHAGLVEQLGRDQACALLEAFRSEAEQFVARALASAWDSEPLSVRADEVHKLAGSAAVLGAAELRARLKELERDYRRGQVEAARKNIADLQAVWDRTRNEIAACLSDAPTFQDNVRAHHPKV